MEKYLKLFAALERIFGKGYVSRLMGKQSNVITLPDKQARKFLDTELNIMEASEGAVKKGVQDLNNLVSDTKRLSTLNDQELLTITNNAERLAVKVNPPAPPPAPTADVLSITTKVNKNKDPNVLIDEYNKNQTRLRLTDDEGGTAISYDEFRKLQSRNNEIEKTLESLNVKPALDEVKPEGIVIPFTKKTEDFAIGGRAGYAKGGILKFLSKLIKNKDVNKTSIDLTEKELKYLNELITDTGGGKFKAEILEEVPSLTIKNNKLIVDQGDLDSFSKYLDDLYLYELAPSGRGANLMPPRLRGSALFDDSVVGKLFRQSKATGGRVGMAGGGILKLAMKFFNDNNPVSAYKKYLKYVKETAQKDPAKLAPEVGGIVVGSELIHRGLRRKLKEVKEKNNENDSENLETDNRTEKAGGGVSQGLDYLTGIERRGYANGDYAVQAGIKNYLGKQKTATVPIKWKSGKDHPDTELAYITKPEKELLIKLDLHGSMKDGKPNKGPGEIISLNSGGSGNGGSGDGGSGGGGTDTGDMGSEAANNAATDSANASAGIGGGPTDTGDLGSEAANNAATAAAAASVGMGTFSPYSRPGMIAKNISNYMMGNPTTSIGLTALGSMLGIPGLGVMNAASSIYGGGRSSSSIGSGQGEDGSGDGEDGRDGRTFIPSFDTTLLTPDLAKNRDYRLYQGANNPFYSMQAVPSGGINNVYTEFQNRWKSWF
jgi:hypothetical protein